MLFPIAIEKGDATHAFGVVVPDIPGCFSAGDTLHEAISNAKEAIKVHLEWITEEDLELPIPSSLASCAANQAYAGFVWATVEIDMSQYQG